jgi:hypothetical protein
MEWTHVPVRIRTFVDFAEADKVARQIVEEGGALIAHSCQTSDGQIGVRMLLPLSACETTAVLSPEAATCLGSWCEISAIVESLAG